MSKRILLYPSGVRTINRGERLPIVSIHFEKALSILNDEGELVPVKGAYALLREVMRRGWSVVIQSECTQSEEDTVLHWLSSYNIPYMSFNEQSVFATSKEKAKSDEIVADVYVDSLVELYPNFRQARDNARKRSQYPPFGLEDWRRRFEEVFVERRTPDVLS